MEALVLHATRIVKHAQGQPKMIVLSVMTVTTTIKTAHAPILVQLLLKLRPAQNLSAINRAAQEAFTSATIRVA